MTQYGKSWANIKPPAIRGGGEETQGHPTVESGMPMMEYVPSTDRWASYGAFYSAEGMDNFFNIAFKSDEGSKIKVDGRSLSGGFGGSVKKLVGTPYSYIRTKIGAGDHTVETTEDGVRFAAWTYGSLDGLNQGRAYGTPVSIDLAIACDDSLTVPGELVCGDVKAKGQILPLNSTCGSLFAIYAEALNNYELIVDEEFSSGDMVGNFEVNVLNKEEDATATILVVSRSGNVVEKTYTYLADKISFTPESVDWGAIAIGTPVPNAQEIKVKNLTNRPVNLQNIKAKSKPGVFKVISPAFPFMLAPNAEITLSVTATITSTQEQIDTLVAVLDCYEKNLSEVRARGEAPIIAVDDINWGKLPSVSQGVRKEAFIYNRSGVELIVTGYDKNVLGNTYADGKNFFAAEGLESFPIKIQAGEKYKFSVMYSPQGVAGVAHTADVPFYSNAQKIDSISVLNGIGTEDVLSVTNAEWNERVIDNIQTGQGINDYKAVIKFRNDGSAAATFNQPVLRGADAANFRIVDNGDVGTFPIQLTGGQEKYINVAFVPTELTASRGAEREYTAEILFPNNSAAGTQTVATLKGTAWQPHVKGGDYDFGTFNSGDAVATGYVGIENTSKDGYQVPSTGSAKGTHAVRITGINIVPSPKGNATDVQLFSVKNLPTPAAPWFMQPEDAVKQLEVQFDPRISGTFYANYEIITDQVDKTNGAAPYVPVYELKAIVEGTDFEVEGASAEVYVYRTTTLKVKVTNTESTKRRFDIQPLTGPDAGAFTVVAPFIDVEANSSATIDVVFSPDEISKVAANQTADDVTGKNWLTDKGVAQGLKLRTTPYTASLPIVDAVTGLVKEAPLTGDGLYLETANFIGTDYRLAPGQSVNVAVQLRGLPEKVDNGDVTALRVRIDGFAPRLVFPRADKASIITAGTLTEGWTVVDSYLAKDANGAVVGLIIDIVDQRPNPVPLTSIAANDVLLKVTFDAFLGSSGVANSQFTSPINVRTNVLPRTEPNAVSSNHVLIQDYPGSITVDPKCAGVARLINVGNKTFAVKGISPNPTSNNATINYSIGIDCPNEYHPLQQCWCVGI